MTIVFADGADIRKTHDGTDEAIVEAADLVFQAGQVVQGDQLLISLSASNARYDNASAGTGKEVTLPLSGIALSGDDADNYAIGNTLPVHGEVGTIDRDTVDGLTFDHATVVYDGTAHDILIKGALPQGVTVSYTGNGQQYVGSYTVTALISGGADYDDITLRATLTIEPAELLIVAQSARKLLGTDDPELLYNVQGLANGDAAPDVLSGELQRIAGEEVGDYPIGIGSLEPGTNYRLRFEQGTLSIHQGVALEAGSHRETIRGGEQVHVSVQLRNTWHDAYAADSEVRLHIRPGQGMAIAEIQSAYFTIQQQHGDWILTSNSTWEASEMRHIEILLIGDGSYAGASYIEVSVWNPYNKGIQADSQLPIEVQVERGEYRVIASNVFTPNGDGINDTFYFQGLELHDRAELIVLNRFGDEVYRNRDYKNDWTAPNVNDGTYFYVLEVWRYDPILKRDVRSFFRGSVLVKRN